MYPTTPSSTAHSQDVSEPVADPDIYDGLLVLQQIFRKALLSREVLAELLYKIDPAGSHRHDIATAHDILKAAVGRVFNKDGPDPVLRWVFRTFKELLVEAMLTMAEWYVCYNRLCFALI